MVFSSHPGAVGLQVWILVRQWVGPMPLLPAMAIRPSTPARQTGHPWGCAADEPQSTLRDEQPHAPPPAPQPCKGAELEFKGLL